MADLLDPYKSVTSSVGTNDPARVDFASNYGPPLNGSGRLTFTESLPINSRKKQTSYAFKLNPFKLQVDHPKLENYVLTKYGFERQYWGNGLWTFVYDGSTGVFQDSLAAQNPRLPQSGFDITKTSAWRNFMSFNDFYLKAGENNVRMEFWGYTFPYLGSINNFSFTYDADKEPFRILYKFKYTAFPLTPIPTTIINDSKTALTTTPEVSQAALNQGLDPGATRNGT